MLSPQARTELLDEYSADDIDGWLSARGGRMGVEPDPKAVAAIETRLQQLWTFNFRPSIRLDDRKVLQSAAQEGLTLLTTDKQILKNAPRIGMKAEKFTY